MSYTSCSNCGCETTDLSSCPSCEVDPVTQIIPCGKYVKVTDHCKRERLLENREQSLLYSNGNQACFYDGSDSKKLLLGNLRQSAGINSVAGLHNNALTQLVPSGSETKWLRYQAGSISFAELFQTPCYKQSTVDSLSGAGFIAFLYDDGSGNYCIKRLRYTHGVGDTQKRLLTQDSSNQFDFAKYHNFDHDNTSCVIYFWNKTTEQVEKLGPPTLGAGEAYSDFRLSLNNTTGCPEWTRVASQVLPAMGEYRKTSTTNASSAADVQVSLSKNWDGGGGTPRFGVAGYVSVTADGQVQAIATGQCGPVASAKWCGMFWSLNGVEVTNTYGRVYVAVASAGPQSTAIYTGPLTTSDQLALMFRSEGSTAELFFANVSVQHFPEIP